MKRSHEAIIKEMHNSIFKLFIKLILIYYICTICWY